MAYTAAVLFVLLNLAACMYYLSRSLWKGVRDRELAVGKPPRKVTLRLNRGEYVRLITCWVVLLAALLALFGVFLINLRDPDGLANWFSRRLTQR